MTALTRDSLLLQAMADGLPLDQALAIARDAWAWVQGDSPAPPPCSHPGTAADLDSARIAEARKKIKK